MFCTYQSTRVLIDAVRESARFFDVGVFDEAHRTAGQETEIWGLCLSDDNVPITKRLFMTATPRVHAPQVKRRALDENIVIYSMDDEQIYGKPCYELSFGDAIRLGLLSDYEIVVIELADSDCLKILREHGFVTAGDKSPDYDANLLAKQIALLRAIEQFGLRRLFTFHSTVAEAKRFVSPTHRQGLKRVASTFLSDIPSTRSLRTFHINGGMPSGVRLDVMENFETAGVGLVSNARCLTEGVNVPDVDCVAFMDRKESLIDIVQATGRALRKTQGKSKGYIFVPLVTKKDADINEITEGIEFDTVARVVMAMADQDARMEALITELRINEGLGISTDRPADFPIKIIARNLDFAEKFFAKIVEKTSSSFAFWYELLLKYREVNGDCNVPARYEMNGFRLGAWVSNLRIRLKAGLLSIKSVSRLDSIGFMWDPLADAWEAGYNALIAFKEKYGHCNVHQKRKILGFNLGAWTSIQRDRYRLGKVSADRIRRLEEIGFVWNSLSTKWEKGFAALLAYKDEHGDCNVPGSYKASGVFLGIWVSTQRRVYKAGHMSPDRVDRLEAFGFVWDPLSDAWNDGFGALLSFKNRIGHCNAPHSHVEGGFKLGNWIAAKRNAFRRGALPAKRIKQLEDIGFVWSPISAAWEKGFSALLIFKGKDGHCNVPSDYRGDTSLHLGAWVSNQRSRYKQGLVSPAEVDRLNAIGFTWRVNASAWENSFDALLTFRTKYGHCNVPPGYITENGIKLVDWVRHQRYDLKSGRIPSERLEKLQKLGFVLAPLTDKWEDSYNALVSFSKTHGNCNVPGGYTTQDGLLLGAWVRTQRRAFRTRKLLSEREQRLKEIGFILDPLEATWRERYNALMAFKEKYGHCNV